MAGNKCQQLKADAQRRFYEELDSAIRGDDTGRGFIYDMFIHELEQSSYTIGADLQPLLSSLGLVADRVNRSKPLLNGLRMAIEDYKDDLDAGQE